MLPQPCERNKIYFLMNLYKIFDPKTGFGSEGSYPSWSLHWSQYHCTSSRTASCAYSCSVMSRHERWNLQRDDTTYKHHIHCPYLFYYYWHCVTKNFKLQWSKLAKYVTIGSNVARTARPGPQHSRYHDRYHRGHV